MDNRSNTSPPPIFQLPPIHSTKNSNNFPVLAIAVIGILATAFLLISYYIFVIKCCLTWHRVDVFNRFFSRVRDSTIDYGSPTTTMARASITDPEKRGLDEALIRSIPVIEFRELKQERKLNGSAPASASAESSYECAVCLSEFEEGERLRVIPNCCHGFHIDCIDIWLQSNANCPLCRSAISPSSILFNSNRNSNTCFGIDLRYKGEQNDTNEIGKDDDDDDDDYVVIEIRGNNLDEPRLVRRELDNNNNNKKLRHVWSVGDEMIDMRKKDEEFENIQPIRRSISMDLSSDRQFCVEIQQCCSSSNNRSSNNNVQENEVSGSSSNYSKVKRSIFSFGYGRSSSRCSVQPLHLDP